MGARTVSNGATAYDLLTPLGAGLPQHRAASIAGLFLRKMRICRGHKASRLLSIAGSSIA